MDSTSLTKPVDLQGLSLALAKMKADYEAQIENIDLTGFSYSLSMSGNVITLTGTDGSTSNITLPIYNGEIGTGGSY